MLLLLLQGKKVLNRAYVSNLTLSVKFGNNYYYQRFSTSSCAESKYLLKKLFPTNFKRDDIRITLFTSFLKLKLWYVYYLHFIVSLFKFYRVQKTCVLLPNCVNAWKVALIQICDMSQNRDMFQNVFCAQTFAFAVKMWHVLNKNNNHHKL